MVNHLLCRIADLVTEIPAAGDMLPRCQEYLCEEDSKPDVIVNESSYRVSRYSERLPFSAVAYMESAYLFYRELLQFNGFYLHASAIAIDGQAYLFSGNSGVGKSTHTKLWQQLFGAAAQVFNDDKPALRYVEGRWYAYGTPWCGKDGINQNKKVPLAGICFLKQGKENRIQRLAAEESIPRLLSQTIHRLDEPQLVELLLTHLDKLLREIPIYELENRPNIEAAKLSYNTMSCGAKETGL